MSPGRFQNTVLGKNAKTTSDFNNYILKSNPYFPIMHHPNKTTTAATLRAGTCFVQPLPASRDAGTAPAVSVKPSYMYK